MKQKLIFFLLLLVSVSQAAWDMYPVPSGMGGGFRFRNMVSYGMTGTSEDLNTGSYYFDGPNAHENTLGKHTIDARFYAYNFEIALQVWGYQWSDNENFGAQDLAFSFRYNVYNLFNVFLDLDGIPWGRSNANTRYLKLGAQFSGKPSSRVFLGSEIAIKNPFQKTLDSHFRRDYYSGIGSIDKVVFDQGGILNLSFEANYCYRHWIWFAGVDFETQLNATTIYEYFDADTYINSYYDIYNNYVPGHYATETQKYRYNLGSGDCLFQLNFGFSYAFSPTFSIEEENFIRFGNLKTTTLSNALNFKWML